MDNHDPFAFYESQMKDVVTSDDGLYADPCDPGTWIKIVADLAARNDTLFRRALKLRRLAQRLVLAVAVETVILVSALSFWLAYRM